MKKIILAGIVGFALGALVLACAARYASTVWAYNQLARSRETLMTEAYKAYAEKRYADAAALAKGANRIAGLDDEQWGLSMPYSGSVFRSTGTYESIRVKPSYNGFLVAYLYHLAGDEAEANKYYDMAKADGTSRDGADVSAKKLLSAMSASNP